MFHVWLFFFQIKPSHGKTSRGVVCFCIMLCLFVDVDRSQTKSIEFDRWQDYLYKQGRWRHHERVPWEIQTGLRQSGTIHSRPGPAILCGWFGELSLGQSFWILGHILTCSARFHSVLDCRTLSKWWKITQVLRELKENLRGVFLHKQR